MENLFAKKAELKKRLPNLEENPEPSAQNEQLLKTAILALDFIPFFLSISFLPHFILKIVCKVCESTPPSWSEPVLLHCTAVTARWTTADLVGLGATNLTGSHGRCSGKQGESLALVLVLVIHDFCVIVCIGFKVFTILPFSGKSWRTNTA